MRVATTPVTPVTRKEDDRLRKELQNADIEKFKKAIKPIISPSKAKGRNRGRKRNIS
jgi:hypothetical protein